MENDLQPVASMDELIFIKNEPTNDCFRFKAAGIVYDIVKELLFICHGCNKEVFENYNDFRKHFLDCNINLKYKYFLPEEEKFNELTKIGEIFFTEDNELFNSNDLSQVLSVVCSFCNSNLTSNDYLNHFEKCLSIKSISEKIKESRTKSSIRLIDRIETNLEDFGELAGSDPLEKKDDTNLGNPDFFQIKIEKPFENELPFYKEASLFEDNTVTSRNKCNIPKVYYNKKLHSAITSNNKKEKCDCSKCLQENSDMPYQQSKCSQLLPSTCIIYSDNDNLLLHNRPGPYKCAMCTNSYATESSLQFHNDFECKPSNKKILCKKTINTLHNILQTYAATKPYKCNICNSRFSHSSELNKHKDIHKTNIFYKCYKCEKIFINFSTLTAHKKSEICDKIDRSRDGFFHNPNNLQLFKCDMCPKKFAYKSLLKAHQRIHLETKKLNILYKCNKCEKKFINFLTLTAHKKSVICDKTYRSRGGFIHKWPNKFKRYKCNMCPKKFAYKSLLKAHQRIHLETKKLNIRNLRFSYSSHLNKHKDTHTNDILYKCNKCEKNFINFSTLTAHLKKSEICDKTYRSRGGFIHNWPNSFKRFKCNICPKQFAYKSFLISHQGIHLETKKLNCKFCNLEFTSNCLLKVHMKNKHSTDKTIKKSFVCEVCGKIFDKYHGLNYHYFLHSNDRKPYECNYCGKPYVNRRQLKKHQWIHEGKKEKCSYCYKMFATQTTLRNHIRLIHTGENLHKCNECDKKYVSAPRLLAHQRSQHSDEKPFKCRECGKAFGQMTNCRKHEKIHKERNYSCDVCGKSFHRKCNLVTHIRKHTGEKPYKCDICEMKFTYTSTYHTHRKKKHNIDYKPIT